MRHVRGSARLAAAVIALLAIPGRPLIAAAETPQAATRTFELRIAQRRVPVAQRTLRATEGERVELRWSADEPLVLHLHGYDIETRVEPGKPAVTAFAAQLTGRFPVEVHTGDGSKHRHRALLHVEIHPR